MASSRTKQKIACFCIRNLSKYWMGSWQSENFYMMFGKVVQQEGTQKKVRFIRRRRDRLIVGKMKNDLPTISVKVTDPRLFMVLGSNDSHDFHLKHCKSGLNVIVDSESFLVIGDSPASSWNMLLPVTFVVCQENEDLQQEHEEEEVL